MCVILSYSTRPSGTSPFMSTGAAKDVLFNPSSKYITLWFEEQNLVAQLAECHGLDSRHHRHASDRQDGALRSPPVLREELNCIDHSG